MNEEIENFLKKYCSKSLSKYYQNESEIWIAAYIEIIEGPNFSSSTFHRVKSQLELINPMKWPQAVSSVIKNFNPSTHELALLNLTHVAIAEIQDNMLHTIIQLYSLRSYLFTHIQSLVSLPQTQATKFILQLIKFIELWCANLEVEELDLAEALIRIIRFTSILDLKEDDLRLKLIFDKISVPMVSLCKQYACFKYVSSHLVSHILPFSDKNNKNPFIAYSVLKDLMKSPEEGEVEESGIRDKFNYLYLNFEFYYKSPPQSLFALTRESENTSEKLLAVLKHYSEVLPGLSNGNWDTLFIRNIVLSNTYTLRILSLISSGGIKLALQIADFVYSIFANLLGFCSQNRVDLGNIEIMLKILTELRWVPSIVGTISAHISYMSNKNLKDFLEIIWEYLKSFPPTSQGKPTDEEYLRSFKLFIHKNIENLGSLYSEIRRTSL
jgi:hypothetical protein